MNKEKDWLIKRTMRATYLDGPKDVGLFVSSKEQIPRDIFPKCPICGKTFNLGDNVFMVKSQHTRAVGERGYIHISCLRKAKYLLKNLKERMGRIVWNFSDALIRASRVEVIGTLDVGEGDDNEKK